MSFDAGNRTKTWLYKRAISSYIMKKKEMKKVQAANPLLIFPRLHTMSPGPYSSKTELSNQQRANSLSVLGMLQCSLSVLGL